MSLFRSWYFSAIPWRSNIHNNCLVVLFLNNIIFRSSGLNNMVTLDGHVPQYLTSVIFLYAIRLMFTYSRASNGPAWQCCHVFSCTLSAPNSYTHLLYDHVTVSPFWPHNLQSGESTHQFALSACSWATKISASVLTFKSPFLVRSHHAFFSLSIYSRRHFVCPV